jgi:hypothetical protein
MNKLRGILLDLQRTQEKFNHIKYCIKNIPSRRLQALSSGISTVNVTLATLENHLIEAQTAELIKKLLVNNYAAKVNSNISRSSNNNNNNVANNDPVVQSELNNKS